jgi:hypothetical protein
MMAIREHAADCWKDYDGEDGDDDTAFNMSAKLLAKIFINRVAYHVHALNAETTGFMAVSVVPYRRPEVVGVAVGAGILVVYSRMGMESDDQ